jgi:hypothetical protein
MGVIIGQTDPLTGDFYTTWAKLRSPILGQQDAGALTPGSYSTHSYQYPAGEGFTTSYGSPLRFDMRYDSTTWPVGFWRPTFAFYSVTGGAPGGGVGWYGALVPWGGTITNEDSAELTGEVVVASGAVGTFTMTADFFGFYPGQYLGVATFPLPVEQPIFSVGKLNAF